MSVILQNITLHVIMPTAPCTNGQLRLAGSNIENEGRVEVCMNNVWSTVCGDSWGSSDATVVCQQLGYLTQGYRITLPFPVILESKPIVPTGAVAFNAAHFGMGAGPVHFSSVGCTGSESNLINCSRSSFISCPGGHSWDAGVRCQGIYILFILCMSTLSPKISNYFS